MTTPPPPITKPKSIPNKPSLPKAPPPTANRASSRTPKVFSITPWSGEGEGERVVIYGRSGMGKTTLAAMAPKPVFIGVDDGVRKIRDPRNGAVLNAIRGVDTFHDIRDALAQPGIFDEFDTIVLDTITKAEELAEPYIFETCKTDKGATVRNLEGYGWGKGYKHALDTMRLLFQDFDGLIRQGKNIVLLAQESDAKMSNAQSLDFIEAGPKLLHNNKFSNRLELQEWADHVLRIDYLETTVVGEGTVGKIVTTDTTRGIYAFMGRHFYAKTRTLKDPIISFAKPDDDSLWQLLFGDPA